MPVVKEHQARHSLPLIVPVILPSYGERASEMLLTQLTENYKATVILNDVSEQTKDLTHRRLGMPSDVRQVYLGFSLDFLAA